MALKDWRKRNDVSNKDQDIYRKYGTDTELFIINPSSAFTSDSLYHVDIFNRARLELKKTFKAKSQAFKFARKYMRSH